jgi:hypothetical protein
MKPKLRIMKLKWRIIKKWYLFEQNGGIRIQLLTCQKPKNQPKRTLRQATSKAFLTHSFSS